MSSPSGSADGRARSCIGHRTAGDGPQQPARGLVNLPTERCTLPGELDTLPGELDTLPGELDTLPADV
jgi:hypothetical protein